MNISQRDKGLLLILAAVLLVAASYFFAFKPLGEKKEVLKAELATLEAREAELEELEANMDFYKEEIVRLTKEEEKLVEEFPANIKPESEIMYAVELENTVDVKFSALNYGDPINMFTSAAPEASEENTESVGGYTAYCLPMTMSYEASYRGLKDTILHTNEHANRMVIDELTASFDGSSGELSGTMMLNQYYVEGTDRTYTEPYVPTRPIGVSDIFGTNSN
ncbi:MAG: hypothetical protein E7253_03695 [Lachnospiraceae bacterium]|nr:hypothetical protein [Lachnospiraceae bacterium]